MELVIAMTLLVLIGSFGVVRYNKTLENASIDLAGGYLEAVWTAQRFFWLEHGEYAGSLDLLTKEGFLDTADPPALDRYSYGIRHGNQKGFQAFAQRVGSKRWKGRITIDESGDLKGRIKSKGGELVEPVSR